MRKMNTMKQDEQRLLSELHSRAEKGEQAYVREIVRELKIPEKRAAYICEKWTSKGWYDYGAHVLAGWLTDEAPNAKVTGAAPTNGERSDDL
jgi:hypothetical protein